MRRWRHSREGEAHGISSAQGRNYLVGLLFFSFCQVQNSKLLEISYFFIPGVGKLQDFPSKNSKLWEMLIVVKIRPI
jgi:hypothetical protein